MRAFRLALAIAVACPLTMSGGCAPAGYAYDPGSFTPRPLEKPTIEASVKSPTSARLSPEQISLVLGSKSPPPISDCVSWKEIDRRALRAAAVNPGVAYNDFTGDTLREAQRLGWPLVAAKQLFVVLLAAHSDRAKDEAQFVEEQYRKCLEVAAKPGPKYPNVTIGTYTETGEMADILKRQQRLQPCIEYRGQASMVQVYKQKGLSLAQAQEYVASRAYGPGGIVHRGSRETEAMLVRLARVGYEADPTAWTDEYGKSTKDFGAYAYAMCMKGTPF